MMSAVNAYNTAVDDYIHALPDWQQSVCQRVRELVHAAEPDISEEIKFTDRPYFTIRGNVCALLATKDHVNVFIYDPIAPDPAGIINQGRANTTARAVQLYEHDALNEAAFIELVKAVAANNRAGGWRQLKNRI